MVCKVNIKNQYLKIKINFQGGELCWKTATLEVFLPSKDSYCAIYPQFFFAIEPNINKISWVKSCLTLFYVEHSLKFEVLVDELIEMCIRVAILDTVTCSK